MAPVYGAELVTVKKARGVAEGTRAFVEECISFRRERDAGEECRNPGAALVARLRKLAEEAAEDAAAPKSRRIERDLKARGIDTETDAGFEVFQREFNACLESLAASKRVNTDA